MMSDSRRVAADRPATLREVAKRAGVSIATASKVVNGNMRGTSEPTAERVRQAAIELGYRPNRTARGLRTLRQSRIGMVIVDSSPTFLADPFSTHLVAGLANHLGERGFGLLLHGIHPRRFDQSFLVRGLEVDALGVMLSGSPPSRTRLRRRLAALGHPLVIFQERPDPRLADTCFVRQDDRAGARRLAARLLDRRPRSVLHVVPKLAWPAIEERTAGLREALEPAGVALDLLRCDETSAAAMAEAFEAHVAQKGLPDVVAGGNDSIALTALAVLRRRGIRVPAAVGVVGFNAFPFAALAEPALTTVASRAYELGAAGGAALLARLEASSFARDEIVLPVELVPGATDLP